MLGNGGLLLERQLNSPVIPSCYVSVTVTGIWKDLWFDARVRGVCLAFPRNLGIAVLHHPSWLQKLLLSFKISLVLFSLSPQSASSLCWTMPRSIFSKPFDSHVCYKICGLCTCLGVIRERPHVMAHLLVAITEPISLLSVLACPPYFVGYSEMKSGFHFIKWLWNMDTNQSPGRWQAWLCYVCFFTSLSGWVCSSHNDVWLVSEWAEMADCPQCCDWSRMSWEPQHPGERGTWQAPCPIS